MKLFRYRKPSLNTMLGVTKVKRQLKKATGISRVQAFTDSNRIKQKIKQDIGIYNPAITPIRQLAKGKIPGFLSRIKFW